MTFIATADITIAAPPPDVWHALTDPDLIKRYFFGSRVDTDWQPGSPITWSGEYNGTAYQDKGTVLDVEENRRLRVTHFSPMTGLPDEPENYHTLSFDLAELGTDTRVTLTQDNNGSPEEAEKSAANWKSMLDGLKETVEDDSPS
jgi:uncharacterized protein YndB with AHSA1/START domain